MNARNNRVDALEFGWDDWAGRLGCYLRYEDCAQAPLPAAGAIYEARWQTTGHTHNARNGGWDGCQVRAISMRHLLMYVYDAYACRNYAAEAAQPSVRNEWLRRSITTL